MTALASLPLPAERHGVFRNGAIFAILVLLASFSVARTAPPEPRKDLPCDLIGRPLRWGDEVRGARLGFSLLRTRLVYGEPLEFGLEAINPTENGPYVRLSFRDPGALPQVEFTTDNGDKVPFRLQILNEWSGSGSGATIRLWPEGKFARGRYLAPGKYRLSASLECKKDASDPIRWVGKLTTPAITLEIVENDENARANLVPPELRKQAAAWVRDLDSDDFEVRKAAEQGLSKAAADVLPLLEPALEATSLEVSRRARNIVRTLTKSVVEQGHKSERGTLLALFGEPTWKFLGGERGADSLEMLRALGAVYGPLPAPPTDERLNAEQVRKLVGRLEDADPLVRIRAVRGLPKTDDEKLLRALVERLADTYSYIELGECKGVHRHPAASEAAEAIVWQGRAAVSPLVAFARGAKGAGYSERVAWLLGDLGHHEKSLGYLGELLGSPERYLRSAAVEGLRKIGPTAVPLLVKAAKDPKEDYMVRRDALTALGQHGDAKQVGPLLTATLQEKHPELIGPAAEGCGRLKVAGALPALVKVARNEAIDQNARYSAVRSVVQLADRKDAEALLLDLSNEGVHGGVRGVALKTLAELACRRAVPKMLDALADEDWYVRASADHALRALADKPEGVGYDARERDASKWRAWWKEQKP
jgi:HEAT repeat protein